MFGKQEKEEAPEGATETERESGAEDGSSWSFHRRHQRLRHVFPHDHQKGRGKKTLTCLVMSGSCAGVC